jgi:hypothetical protein
MSVLNYWAEIERTFAVIGALFVLACVAYGIWLGLSSDEENGS